MSREKEGRNVRERKRWWRKEEAAREGRLEEMKEDMDKAEEGIKQEKTEGKKEGCGWKGREETRRVGRVR